MGSAILKFKNVGNRKSIVTFADGKMALLENHKEISARYDSISDFKYDDDLNMSVAVVKKSIGDDVKDTLFGYIDSEGNLLSYIYSTYFDKVFCTSNENLDSLVQYIENHLKIESNLLNSRKEKGIKKILLLSKIKNKDEYQ